MVFRIRSTCYGLVRTRTFADVQIRRTNVITFNYFYDLLKNLCQT